MHAVAHKSEIITCRINVADVLNATAGNLLVLDKSFRNVKIPCGMLGGKKEHVWHAACGEKDTLYFT